MHRIIHFEITSFFIETKIFEEQNDLKKKSIFKMRSKRKKKKSTQNLWSQTSIFERSYRSKFPLFKKWFKNSRENFTKKFLQKYFENFFFGKAFLFKGQKRTIGYCFIPHSEDMTEFHKFFFWMAIFWIWTSRKKRSKKPKTFCLQYCFLMENFLTTFLKNIFRFYFWRVKNPIV